MNVLVSGGTGFIGRALVGKLIENGNKIVILTRDKRKVDSFLKEKVEVLETDICNSALLENLVLKLQCIDAFIHLAASLDYFGDKKRLFRVNVEGTVNLFNLAKRNRIKKFAYISSIEAIGTIDKESIPADETFVCRPVSTYGESKLEAESYLKKYAERIDLQVCTLRLGNVYGPGSPSFIVPIANAIINKDKLLNFLPVYGERYLHPAYITDIVEGIIKSIQDFDTAKTYILAGEEYITIGRLFELIAQELNVDMNLRSKKRSIKDVLYLNLRKRIHRFCKKADLLTYFMSGEGRRIHRAYSIEKAKKELGYSPKVSLRNGVAKTIEWAKRKGLLKD